MFELFRTLSRRCNYFLLRGVYKKDKVYGYSCRCCKYPFIVEGFKTKREAKLDLQRHKTIMSFSQKNPHMNMFISNSGYWSYYYVPVCEESNEV